MTRDQLITWVAAHPWPTTVGALVALGLTGAAVWGLARVARALTPPSAVQVAAVGAFVCTAYTADTSWRFAAHRLGMHDTTERMIMFAAAEIALFACALMARANKSATATPDHTGTTGVPGALVWVITGVQVIPAFAESGIIGGTVRAIIGPVMAGLLWHLAMGLEVRLVRPGALSTGLPAMIGRELRERLLSRLGLAVRDRSAEQISRDRATVRVVRLASRPKLRAWGRHRLAAAVAQSGAATDGTQRHQLMQQLAARRTSAELATVPVHSPWEVQPEVQPYPRTPLGITGAQLRALDPMAAIARVRAAHPDATHAEVSSMCTEYGVPVTETMVRVALRAGNPPRVPMQVTGVPDVPALAPAPPTGLILDLAPMPAPHPAMAQPVPVLAATRTRQQVHARVPSTPVPPGVLDTARAVDAEQRRVHKRPASIRVLKADLRVGQDAARYIQGVLQDEYEARTS